MYKDRTVAVVIPALNEGQAIGEVIDSIPPFVDAVIVIDDGSSDDTAAVAREKGAEVICHGRNRGVGAAFDTGRRRVLALRSDIMVNMDGDGQFEVPHLASGKYKVLAAHGDYAPSDPLTVSVARDEVREIVDLALTVGGSSRWYRR